MDSGPFWQCRMHILSSKHMTDTSSALTRSIDIGDISDELDTWCTLPISTRISPLCQLFRVEAGNKSSRSNHEQAKNILITLMRGQLQNRHCQNG